jgi:hypothetical protein
MSRKFKENIKRIDLLFKGVHTDSSRSRETLTYYKDYLEGNLKFPVDVTGIEDFDWEEFYLLGPGDKREYEYLKKTKPSYKDIFSLKKIGSSYDDLLGLLAHVNRISDNKKFQIPLMDLKAVDKKTREYDLLDDYSIWFINYQ